MTTGPLSEDDLVEKAEAEYRSWAGTVVLVREAELGTGSDVGSVRLDPPLRVRLNDALRSDQMVAVDGGGDSLVLQTYYEGQALGPLPEGFTHLSWVYGPAYHQDGSREAPPFVPEIPIDPVESRISRQPDRGTGYGR